MGTVMPQDDERSRQTGRTSFFAREDDVGLNRLDQSFSNSFYELQFESFKCLSSYTKLLNPKIVFKFESSFNLSIRNN